MATQPVTQTGERRTYSGRLLIIGLLVALALLIIVGVLSLSGTSAAGAGSGSVLVLALPAFLAGVLSFLSPCTLPILPAYFAFTFQARRQSVVLMTVAFFLGLATTMVVLGASATALSTLVYDYRNQLTLWGGILVIGLGIMSFLGKGFAGPQLQSRPSVSVAGSYLYGATFALGWTACVGPILGSLLTLLAAQGVAILQGAVLAFIYAMGLGLPLILVAACFSYLGNGSRFWQWIRGKGFELKIGRFTFYLHTTSMISGLLMICMGYLLASGRLAEIAAYAQRTPLASWLSQLEGGITGLFGLQ